MVLNEQFKRGQCPPGSEFLTALNLERALSKEGIQEDSEKSFQKKALSPSRDNRVSPSIQTSYCSSSTSIKRCCSVSGLARGQAAEGPHFTSAQTWTPTTHDPVFQCCLHTWPVCSQVNPSRLPQSQLSTGRAFFTQLGVNITGQSNETTNIPN